MNDSDGDKNDKETPLLQKLPRDDEKYVTMPRMRE